MIYSLSRAALQQCPSIKALYKCSVLFKDSVLFIKNNPMSYFISIYISIYSISLVNVSIKISCSYLYYDSYPSRSIASSSSIIIFSLFVVI